MPANDSEESAHGDPAPTGVRAHFPPTITPIDAGNLPEIWSALPELTSANAESGLDRYHALDQRLLNGTMHGPVENLSVNSSGSPWHTRSSLEEAFANQFLADLELPEASQITLIVLYSTTTLLAVLGNLLAIIVLAVGKRSKKGLRKYLINLAVSDLCMACFCMPFTFTKSMLGKWIFGKIMCHIVLYMQVTSVAVSVYTNVAIGIDRYLAVTKPVKQRLTKTKTGWIIAGTWAASALFGSVQLFIGRITEINLGEGVSIWQCTEVLESYWKINAYNAYIFCITYLIPLLVLSFVYYKIGYALWQRQTPGNADTLRDLTRANSLRRVTKMLLIVVIAFAVCWLPTHLFIMTIDFAPSLLTFTTHQAETLFFALFFTCHWLAMSNSVLNPIIYCFLNEGFRADLKYMYLVRKNRCRQLISTVQFSQFRRDRGNARRTSSRSFLTWTFKNRTGRDSSTSDSRVSISPPRPASELSHPGTAQSLRHIYLENADTVAKRNEVVGMIEADDMDKV